MRCLCGHEEKDHPLGGRCRVPDCPCAEYRPLTEIGRRAPGYGEVRRWASPIRNLLATLLARRRPTRPLYWPLTRVVVCLDCEACFPVAASSCPACGSDTWIPVARFLDRSPAIGHASAA
jgi:hypothetical protein